MVLAPWEALTGLADRMSARASDFSLALKLGFTIPLSAPGQVYQVGGGQLFCLDSSRWAFVRFKR